MNTASQDLPVHLEILRDRLLHPTDYERAFHYFLEEFGGDRKFIELGEVEALPNLVKVLSLIATKALSRPVQVQQSRISAVPGHGFHHGSAAVDGRAAVFFYFEAVNTGLMAIIPGLRGGAEIARFQLPQSMPINPSQN